MPTFLTKRSRHNGGGFSAARGVVRRGLLFFASSVRGVRWLWPAQFEAAVPLLWSGFDTNAIALALTVSIAGEFQIVTALAVFLACFVGAKNEVKSVADFRRVLILTLSLLYSIAPASRHFSCLSREKQKKSTDGCKLLLASNHGSDDDCLNCLLACLAARNRSPSVDRLLVTSYYYADGPRSSAVNSNSNSNNAVVAVAPRQQSSYY